MHDLKSSRGAVLVQGSLLVEIEKISNSSLNDAPLGI